MTERPHILALSPYQAGEMLLRIQSLHPEGLPVTNSRMSARRLMAASPVPGNLTWRLSLVFS